MLDTHVHLSQTKDGVMQAWPGVVEKYNLQVPKRLCEMLGTSQQVSGNWTAEMPGDTLRWGTESTIKIRQAGFHLCVNTADMLVKYIWRFQDLRVIPLTS